MKNTTIDIRPVSASVGAEIHNVDLADPMQDRTYQEIRNALNEHGVIFFRDQNLTPAQHLAFTARFGEVEHDDSNSMCAVPGFPMIGEVRKEPEATRNMMIMMQQGWERGRADDLDDPAGTPDNGTER